MGPGGALSARPAVSPGDRRAQVDPRSRCRLLERDGGAGCLEGGLGLLGRLLVDLLKDGLRRRLDEFLGLLEAKELRVAPKAILEKVNKETAEKAKAALEAAGASSRSSATRHRERGSTSSSSIPRTDRRSARRRGARGHAAPPTTRKRNFRKD